jgi:hypothetical protein
VALALGGSLPAADAPVSFNKDIKPFLAKYCAECHTGANAKEKIHVESFADLVKRSTKGALVVPGKPEQSLLVLTLEGKKKVMPPKKYETKPTAAEIAKVKAWIAAGAKDDSKTDAADADRQRLLALLRD